MGTEDQENTLALQLELRRLATLPGWSINKLADFVFDSMDPDDSAPGDEDKAKDQFREKFRKQLTRASTPAARLESYRDMLWRSPSFRGRGLILPSYQKSDDIPSELREAMEEISREISFQLK